MCVINLINFLFDKLGIKFLFIIFLFWFKIWKVGKLVLILVISFLKLIGFCFLVFVILLYNFFYYVFLILIKVK